MAATPWSKSSLVGALFLLAMLVLSARMFYKADHNNNYAIASNAVINVTREEEKEAALLADTTLQRLLRGDLDVTGLQDDDALHCSPPSQLAPLSP